MKHGFIKVAAATPRVTVADCKANGEEILRAIREMEKEHVKLMVFPEFSITGYTCHDLFLQRDGSGEKAAASASTVPSGARILHSGEKRKLFIYY